MYKILVTTSIVDTDSANGKAAAVHTLVIDFPDEEAAVAANTIINKDGNIGNRGRQKSMLLFVPSTKQP